MLILSFSKNHPPTQPATHQATHPASHPAYWTPYPNTVNVTSEAITLINHGQRDPLKSNMKSIITGQNLASLVQPNPTGMTYNDLATQLKQIHITKPKFEIFNCIFQNII